MAFIYISSLRTLNKPHVWVVSRSTDLLYALYMNLVYKLNKDPRPSAQKYSIYTRQTKVMQVLGYSVPLCLLSKWPSNIIWSNIRETSLLPYILTECRFNNERQYGKKLPANTFFIEGSTCSSESYGCMTGAEYAISWYCFLLLPCSFSEPF